MVTRTETVEFRIKPGTRDGQRIRLQGKGNAGVNGGPAGDLFLIVRTGTHPVFTRVGDDIQVTVPVTVAEASLGAKVDVPTIDGRAQLKIPPGTQSGQKLRMRERGVESAQHPGQRGDQIVTVEVVVPHGAGRAQPRDHARAGEAESGGSARGAVREAVTARSGLVGASRWKLIRDKPMAAKRKSKGAYMISAVAEMYEIHPQTLRLYEREGLLKPSRTEGNTRLYTDEDLERLEFILNLARDLGVNIAGIAIMLQMRERMEEMNRQMQSFVEYVRTEMLTRFQQAAPSSAGAIVPLRKPVVSRRARDAQVVNVRMRSESVQLVRKARSRDHSAVSAVTSRRVFLNLHALRPSWPGRLRPHHIHGLCRHGAVGGAALSARAASRRERSCSAAWIHAAAHAAEAAARSRAGSGSAPRQLLSSRTIPSTKFSSARASRNDAGLRLRGASRRGIRRFPSRFFPRGEPDYINAKVVSMEMMEAAAAHDILVISDSDVRVTPDYLRAVALPFADAQVGGMCCPYRGVAAEGGLWARLEAVGMSVEMTAGVLVARDDGGHAVYARAHDGFSPRDDSAHGRLPGDGGLLRRRFRAGQRDVQAGQTVVLSHHAIDHIVINSSFVASMKHQVRWMKSTRFSRPKGHFGTALTFSMPFGLLGLAAAAMARASGWGLALAWRGRLRRGWRCRSPWGGWWCAIQAGSTCWCFIPSAT